MVNPELRILALFQKFADGVQDYFGYDNFSLARLSMTVRSVGIIVGAPLIFISSKNVSGMTVFSTLFITGVGLYFCWYMNKLVDKVKASCSKRPEFRNPLEISASFMRILFWVFMYVSINSFLSARARYVVATEWWAYWDYLWYVVEVFNTGLFVSYMYFLSCTPKPRKKSKIKKLIEKFAQLFSSQPVVAVVPLRN